MGGKMDKKIEKKLRKYIKKILQVLTMQEMRVLPGNLAFFFVLALIPITTIIISVLSGYTEHLLNLINSVFPKEAANIIVNFITNKGGRGITFNIVTLFIASNGTYAIINAANTLYKVKNTDPIKDRIKAVLLLFILLLLITFLILVPLYGGKILSLFKHYNFYNGLSYTYNMLRWPVSIFLIYTTLKLIFTISPSITIKSKDTTKGAIFTTVIWTITTIVFSFYLQYIANYSALYGNLASIIILMMWIYIISYVFVLGMAINSVEND